MFVCYGYKIHTPLQVAMITVPETLLNTYPIISCYGNSPCSSVVT